MQNAHDETLQRITAHYVAEHHAGRQPKLSDYIQLYPHYADAIAGFVAYYHLIEIPSLPEAANSSKSELTAVSLSALSRLQQRLQQTHKRDAGPVPLRTERAPHLKVAEEPAPFQSERKDEQS